MKKYNRWCPFLGPSLQGLLPSYQRFNPLLGTYSVLSNPYRRQLVKRLLRPPPTSQEAMGDTRPEPAPEPAEADLVHCALRPLMLTVGSPSECELN